MGYGMKRLVLALALSGPFQLPAWAGQYAAPTHDDVALLKGFALARCLGGTLPSIKAEADAAAGGYVEQGSVAFEAYEEIDALAAAFAGRAYASKAGGDLSIMKCFDLLASGELSEIIGRHVSDRP